MSGRPTATVHGVDGCRAGWLRAGLVPGGDGGSGGLEYQLHARFDDCLAATVGEIVVVDMPIGLLEEAEPGGRPCDRDARRMLGQPRGSSVFPPPARPALSADGYADAMRRNGRGMSLQAYNVLAKIREVDAALTLEGQSRVYEGHPEMAFMRLAGAPLGPPKRRAAGRRQRRALLENALREPIEAEAIRERYGRGSVAADDILDAVVLTLTARHVLEGTAQIAGDGSRDARGLEMAIRY